MPELEQLFFITDDATPETLLYRLLLHRIYRARLPEELVAAKELLSEAGIVCAPLPRDPERFLETLPPGASALVLPRDDRRRGALQEAAGRRRIPCLEI